jgi:uncharacterized protein with HEPN domain
METDMMLVILGSFISLLLMVNAYFTRETLLRVVELEIKIVGNATKQSYIEKQLEENTQDIKLLREFRHKHQHDYISIMKLLRLKTGEE